MACVFRETHRDFMCACGSRIDLCICKRTDILGVACLQHDPHIRPGLRRGRGYRLNRHRHSLPRTLTPGIAKRGPVRHLCFRCHVGFGQVNCTPKRLLQSNKFFPIKKDSGPSFCVFLHLVPIIQKFLWRQKFGSPYLAAT